MGKRSRSNAAANARRIKRLERRTDVHTRTIREAPIEGIPLNHKDTVELLRHPVVTGAPVTSMDLPLTVADAHQYVQAVPCNSALVGEEATVMKYNANTNIKAYHYGRNKFLETLVDTPLECCRPLIYEPAVIRSWVGDDRDQQWTAEEGRNVREVKVNFSGGFKIDMHLGRNTPDGWYGSTSREHDTDGDGGHSNADYYGENRYNEPQYVRILGIVVYDMGSGYGPVNNAAQMDTVALGNFTKQEAASNQGIGKYHYLAPTTGDIFQNYARDPYGLMGDTTHNSAYDVIAGSAGGAIPDTYVVYSATAKQVAAANWLNDTSAAAANNGIPLLQTYDDDIMRYTYRQNDRATGTPAVPLISDLAKDPLQGTPRPRSFDVFMDKKVQFMPTGSQSATFNPGTATAMSHEMKWNWSGKIRCTQDDTNGDGYQARKCIGMNKRILFYFMPSITVNINGMTANQIVGHNVPGNVQYNWGTGHHFFTVKRTAEKASWKEY